MKRRLNSTEKTNSKENRTDGFLGVKYDVINAAIVARKFVDDPPAGCVPNVDETVGRSCRNLVAISRP